LGRLISDWFAWKTSLLIRSKSLLHGVLPNQASYDVN
jgi:hypothetical protein